MIRWIQNLNERTVLIVLVTVAITTSVISALLNPNKADVEWWVGWFQNFSTEMMGAVVTFALFELVLGRQKEARDKAEADEKEKQRLIVELRSKDSDTARDALKLILEKKWHIDGTLAKENLHEAYFVDAFLGNSQLSGAVLTEANCQDADLSSANLENANLNSAILEGAYLEYTNLQSSDLRYASLQRADLTGANLQKANLRNANFKGSYLSNASLLEADLGKAVFDERTALPDSEFIVKEKRHTKYWTPETDMNRYTDPNHPDFWQPEWVKKQEKGN